MSYAHTQRGGLHWLLWGTAALCFLGAWGARQEGETAAVAILAGVGVISGVFALCFLSLTVQGGGDALDVRFGPIALFKTRIPYGKIERPVRARSALIDGWGVHWIPGRGWTWNLWGRDCVEMTVDGKRMRIGTDDPDGLAAFLQAQVGAEACA